MEGVSIIPQEDNIVKIYMSNTTFGINYYVRKRPDKSLWCDCPGFSRWRHCRHIEDAKELLKSV